MENKVGEKRARSPSLEGADDYDVDVDHVEEGGVPDPNPTAENVNPEVHQELQAADRLPPVNPNAHMLMLNNIAANANQIGALLQAWVGQQHPGAPPNRQILNQLATNATPEVRAVIQALIVPEVVVQRHQHHPQEEQEEAIGDDDDEVATAGREVAPPPPPPPLNPHILNQIAAANANPEVRAAIHALMVPGVVVGPLPRLQGHDHQAEQQAVGHAHDVAAGQQVADHQQYGLHHEELHVGAGDIGQGVADHQEYGLNQGEVFGAGYDIVQEEEEAADACYWRGPGPVHTRRLTK